MTRVDVRGLMVVAMLTCAGCGQHGAAWPDIVIDPPSHTALRPRVVVTHIEVTAANFAALDRVHVEVDDPLYHRRKRYEGVQLAHVLRAHLAPASLRDDSLEVAFLCADGYRPTLPLTTAVASEGVIALRDMERTSGWEPMARERSHVDPGPAYLVWPPSTAAHEQPWPYAIVAIEVAIPGQTANQPSEDAPLPVKRGADLFQHLCSRCHSINLIGGTVGPELNVPANVTEYWHPVMLRRVITRSADLRYGSKMPAFDNLGAADVDNLLEYLAYMRRHKIIVSHER